MLACSGIVEGPGILLSSTNFNANFAMPCTVKKMPFEPGGALDVEYIYGCCYFLIAKIVLINKIL